MFLVTIEHNYLGNYSTRDGCVIDRGKNRIFYLMQCSLHYIYVIVLLYDVFTMLIGKVICFAVTQS